MSARDAVLRVDLRSARLNRGFSIRQLAREIDVPEQTIRRAEDGLGISPANAFKIASFFGYKVTEIWPVDAFTGQAA